MVGKKSLSVIPFLNNSTNFSIFKITYGYRFVIIFFLLFKKIFDSDGDGMLSYEEFIAIMKDRVNRGLKTFSRQEGWAGFKRCVKQELRSKAA